MAEKILIIEDEKTLLETLQYQFKHLGFDVITAEDGKVGLMKAREAKPDLVILDIMLPSMDGFEVCRELRKDFSMPILMLTARDDEIDRVVGLEVGADDYLIKPFSMRELTARIKALLRRTKIIREGLARQEQESQILNFGNLVIDTGRHEVKINNAVVPLKPREYDLLLLLAHHRGKTLSREFILETVWGWNYFGNARNVDVHIRWLREKLEDDPGKPTRIITVRSAGYRFEG
jgi:DNA-binding response OmpR family regulator